MGGTSPGGGFGLLQGAGIRLPQRSATSVNAPNLGIGAGASPYWGLGGLAMDAKADAINTGVIEDAEATLCRWTRDDLPDDVVAMLDALTAVEAPEWCIAAAEEVPVGVLEALNRSAESGQQNRTVWMSDHLPTAIKAALDAVAAVEGDMHDMAHTWIVWVVDALRATAPIGDDAVSAAPAAPVMPTASTRPEAAGLLLFAAASSMIQRNPNRDPARATTRRHEEYES